MADGEVTPEIRPLRPAAPGFAGPLAESGAAPPVAETETSRTDAPTPVAEAPPVAEPAPVTEATTAGTPSDADPDAPLSTALAPTAEPPAPAGDAAAVAPADERGPDPTTPAAPEAPETPAAAVAADEKAADQAEKGPDPDGKAPDPDGKSPDPAAPAGDATAESGDVAAEPRSTRRRRFRVPFGRARRLPGPRQLAVRSARAVHAWSRRPSGRVALPGGLVLLLIAGSATAGAVLVPAAAPAPRPSATNADAGAGPATPTAPAQTPPLATPPGDEPTGLVPPAGPVGGRPADVLAGWAQQTGARVEIPPTAMQAYGYAELVLAQTKPTCQLTWTTLAAIGLVESAHGSANDAVLGADGQAVPHIIGLPLDGKGGRQRISDTDGGQLDGDTTYDRAVGPMQFIPTTWRENGVDADNDGVENPHDIDDAALAAGNYLCANGRNLSSAEDWWNAILSYNDVRPYAQAVFDAANRYGTGSRA